MPRGQRVQDAGSAGFRYAAALDAFFRPAALVGIEVEGHRLLRDGRSRIDHARGYVAPFPHARFVVADYTAFDESADVITMFYPFVTVAPLLAWRLPLEVFAPEAWFARAARNLAPGGLLVVVSHGDDEAGIAKRLCAAQDLTAVGGFRDDGPLLPRPRPAVVTLWRR
ncbi:MAG: class I SAM-dependent methyltransferase [Steroidobacteraceae bacterium]